MITSSWDGQDNQAMYTMFLTNKQVDHLSSLPFISSVTLQDKTNNGPEDDIFPSSDYSKWNGDAYGPLVIPKKGMSIDINDSTLAYYGETIQLYEHLDNVSIANGKLTIDGKACESYTFTSGLLLYDGRQPS